MKSVQRQSRTIWGTIYLLLTLLFSVGFISCGDDENGSGNNDNEIFETICGTWTGSKTVAQTGSVRSISLTLYSNGTGTFIYTSKVYCRVAEFSFSIQGTTIYCKGVIAGEDGVVNEFNQQFEYRTSHIMPVGAYGDIILTK